MSHVLPAGQHLETNVVADVAIDDLDTDDDANGHELTDLLVESADDRARRRVLAVIEQGTLRTVLQPIVHLDSGHVIGVEALTRFPEQPSPAEWFADAARTGMGPALELAAAVAAVGHVDHLPRGVHLSLNASVTTTAVPAFAELVAAQDPGRIVVELTFRTGSSSLDEVVAAVELVVSVGARVALDDVGGGLLDLHDVVGVRPHILKLDRDVVRTLGDPGGLGAARALVAAARDLGAFTIAKGVETRDQLLALVELGVDAAQGNYLAAPDEPPLRTTSIAIA